MTNTLRKTFSLFALSVCIYLAGCQKDDIGISNQESAVVNAKEWLERSKPDLEALKFTKTIDWNNAIVLNNDGEQAVEVPLVLFDNISTNVVDDKEYKTNMRLLFIKNEDGAYKVFDIVYTTNEESFDNKDKSFNILDIGSQYSGFITIQNSNDKIVYSGKYENGEFQRLHNFDQGLGLTNRLVCTYYVTVGPYTTCSNWVWYPDYTSTPGGNLPPGYMPGISGPIHLNIPVDPCVAATKASGIAANAGFISARAAVSQAGAADGNEHSITLGTPGASGAYTQSAIKNGGTNGVAVNETLAGAFAAIHNHPNNTALSSGDIYAAVTLNTKNPNFTTSIILTGGETYAIVVTNLANAQNFVKNYPPDLSPNYPPEFPDVIFNQIDLVNSQIGSSIDSKTAAISSVLDKYNAGITLMKQDSSGKFNRVKIQASTNPDGTVRYAAVPCN